MAGTPPRYTDTWNNGKGVAETVETVLHHSLPKQNLHVAREEVYAINGKMLEGVEVAEMREKLDRKHLYIRQGIFDCVYVQDHVNYIQFVKSCHTAKMRCDVTKEGLHLACV